MRKLTLTAGFLFFCMTCFAQNVGIGTNTPNAKAALEVKATDKGVLFPRLTTVQRNAISSPPDGLHVYNTDEHCLNVYDSVNKIWNCYCIDCATLVITVSTNACRLDFYNSYARFLPPARKYVVNIAAGVQITGCAVGDTALLFSTMPYNAEITINNYGTIAGAGGRGGNGRIEQGCYFLLLPATAGFPGGPAVATKAGVSIKINNYGLIAGGGGGGGGSGAATSSGYGGGGGGGAGTVPGIGGMGGGYYVSSPIIGCVGAISSQGQNGGTGTATTGGAGGAGVAGGVAGGSGGNRGEAGANGTWNATTIPGGAAGKAIAGGSGNSITNQSGGQVFGPID